MILWLVLFALVIAISFVLALQSMADFQESPQHFDNEYGLFLIRNTAGLNAAVLESLHNQIIKEGYIVSLERLFKGMRSALVIFGPKDILANFSSQLNLLELEDYVQVDQRHTQAWEVGVRVSKSGASESQRIESFFNSFPMLEQAEQFWWQLTLQAETGGFKMPNFKAILGRPNMQSEVDYLMARKGKNRSFKSQIRAVVFCQDQNRRRKLSEILQSLPSGHLTKVPKPFTSDQIVEFYKSRSLGKDEANPVLTTEEVLKLSLLSP